MQIVWPHAAHEVPRRGIAVAILGTAAAILVLTVSCAPAAVPEPTGTTSPTAVIEVTPSSTAGARPRFSLDPPTPTAIAIAMPTPVPDHLLGRALILGSGQSGDVQEGTFRVDRAAVVGDGQLLVLGLRVPNSSPDGTSQTMVTMVHSAFFGQLNYIDLPTIGRVLRLHLYPDGTLHTDPYPEEDRVSESFKPGATARTYVIPLNVALIEGEAHYSFRMSNIGLSPMVVEVTLESTSADGASIFD